MLGGLRAGIFGIFKLFGIISGQSFFTPLFVGTGGCLLCWSHFRSQDFVSSSELLVYENDINIILFLFLYNGE